MKQTTENIYLKFDDVMAILKQMKKVSNQSYEAAAQGGDERAEAIFRMEMEAVQRVADILNHDSVKHYRIVSVPVEEQKLQQVPSWSWHDDFKVEKPLENAPNVFEKKG